jgi:uncharacterized cupin superfamily protein
MPMKTSSSCSKGGHARHRSRREDTRPGMAAGFPAGNANGHHLINRNDRPALYLEVGTRAQTEEAQYSDIDMMARKVDGRFVFTRRNGEPYK